MRALRQLAFALLLAAPSAAGDDVRVIEITARRFEYEPSHLVLKRGVPVILRFHTADRRHGFKAPGLGLKAEINPGAPVDVRFTPETSGTFPFACHLFCGSGHDDMSGEIVVE